MDITKQPGINFDNIFLTRLNFERKPNVTERPKINVAFHATVSFNEDKKRLVIELLAELKEEKGDSFKIECAMVGIFSAIEGQENMPLDEFAKLNGPALMLPYLREVIADTTMRSGMKPFVLPPINIKSVIHKSEKRTSDK